MPTNSFLLTGPPHQTSAFDPGAPDDDDHVTGGGSAVENLTWPPVGTNQQDANRLAAALAQYASLCGGGGGGEASGIEDDPSVIWATTASPPKPLRNGSSNGSGEDHNGTMCDPFAAAAMAQHQFLMQQQQQQHQQHQQQQQLQAFNEANACGGGGGASSLLKKKGFNMTECVPVPSSEHVAEIVGRQGCKIKALRAKTNTYIKTPVRGEEPVFVVTGRKEDVMAAKREIMSAAEHFSQIRASRKNSSVGTTGNNPLLLCNGTQHNGGRMMMMMPELNNPNHLFTNNNSSTLLPSSLSSTNGAGGINGNGQYPSWNSLMTTNSPEDPTCNSNSNPMNHIGGLVRSGPEFMAGQGAINGQNQQHHHNQCTVKVRVPYKVVGLVVGPKGATIKRIQQMTHTYIVTPSRDREPVFEITGTFVNVESARLEIENHIAVRTAAAAAQGTTGGIPLFNGPAIPFGNDILSTTSNEVALLNNIMNLVGAATAGNSCGGGKKADPLAADTTPDYRVDSGCLAPRNCSPTTSSTTLELQRMLLQTLAVAAANNSPSGPLLSQLQHQQHDNGFQQGSFGMSGGKRNGTAIGNHHNFAGSEDDMTLLEYQTRNRVGLGPNQQHPHGKRYNSDPMTTGLLPGLNESMANLSLFQRIMENVMNEGAHASMTSTGTGVDDNPVGDASCDAQSYPSNHYHHLLGNRDGVLSNYGGMGGDRMACEDGTSATLIPNNRCVSNDYGNHCPTLYDRNNSGGLGRYSNDSLLVNTPPSSSPSTSRSSREEVDNFGCKNVNISDKNDLVAGSVVSPSANIPLTISQLMEQNSIFADNIMRVVAMGTASPPQLHRDAMTITQYDDTKFLVPSNPDSGRPSQAYGSSSARNAGTFGTRFGSQETPSTTSCWDDNPKPASRSPPTLHNENSLPFFTTNHDSSKSCLVCKVRDRVAALVPCGHTMFCMDCATEVKSCPVCHRGATQAIRIYS